MSAKHTRGACGRDSCFQLFPGHTKECWDARAADLRIVRCPKHTPGALVLDEHYPTNVYGNDVTGGLLIAACGFRHVARPQEESAANARLLAAAYTSYDKHCGPRAVECAEADLLGKALEALKHLAGLFQQLHPNHSEWGDYKAALAVLAKVKP